jgi:hypothetical protein
MFVFNEISWHLLPVRHHRQSPRLPVKCSLCLRGKGQILQFKKAARCLCNRMAPLRSASNKNADTATDVFGGGGWRWRGRAIVPVHVVEEATPMKEHVNANSVRKGKEREYLGSRTRPRLRWRDGQERSAWSPFWPSLLVCAFETMRTNTRTRYFTDRKRRHTKSEAIARRVRRKAPGQAFSALPPSPEKRPRLKSRVKRAAGPRTVPTQAKDLQCGGHKAERATQSGAFGIG